MFFEQMPSYTLSASTGEVKMKNQQFKKHWYNEQSPRACFLALAFFLSSTISVAGPPVPGAKPPVGGGAGSPPTGGPPKAPGGGGGLPPVGGPVKPPGGGGGLPPVQPVNCSLSSATIALNCPKLKPDECGKQSVWYTVSTNCPSGCKQINQGLLQAKVCEWQGAYTTGKCIQASPLDSQIKCTPK